MTTPNFADNSQWLLVAAEHLTAYRGGWLRYGSDDENNPENDLWGKIISAQAGEGGAVVVTYRTTDPQEIYTELHNPKDQIDVYPTDRQRKEAGA
jgi:hypothetical protein